MNGRTFWRSAEAFRFSKPLLCVLDFDGTLAPLVEHAGRARMTSSVRRLLERLRGVAEVAVVSGRALKDVRRRVGVRGIVYGGNHGVELAGRGQAFLHPAARRLKKRAGNLHRRAQRVFKSVPGVFVEGKGFGVSVHFRRVPPLAREAFDRGVRKLKREAHALAFLWTRGHKVWDVRPATGWNKGRALNRLWRRMGKPFVVCVGDDVTDEDMFRSVRGKGFGVKVGQGVTRAGYRLSTQKEVSHLLRRILKEIEKETPQ